MNKKLIVVSIAAALAAPLAAQAGVEIYGDARVSLDYVQNNDKTTGLQDNTASLTSNYSYIGLKGNEDLGAGLTALWQIEQDVQFDTGAWGTTSRPTYVGLGSGFGTVLAGNLATPYRVATQRLDPFSDTRADYNAIIGSFGGAQIFNDEAFTKNTIAYMSPDFGGFNASVAYILADALTGNDTLSGAGTAFGRTSLANDRSAYSLSVDYNNGPIFATAAYESLNKAGLGGGTGTPDTKAWKVGGSYTLMEATTIGALFENIDVGGLLGNRNAWSVSASHKIGGTSLMAAVNGADKDKVSKTGAMQYSLGVKQGLSKNTDVYAVYTQVSNDGNAAYGLDNTPGGPYGVVALAGKDMWAVSFGIDHRFSSK